MSGLTRTNFERQIDHAAVLAHGAHPKYRVEHDGEVDVSTTAKATVNQNIKQGSVVYLDSTTGQYNLGLAAATSSANNANFPVPFISLKNAFDPDVTTGVLGNSEVVSYTVSQGGSTTTSSATFYNPRRSTYSAVGGKITAIPCTAGYEIETTEFVDGVYLVNDALTASNADDATKGKLKRATAVPFKASGSQPILGFVSRVPYTNDAYLQKRIGFWTNFIPAVGA